MNSICNQGDAAKENISFVKEIQMMMFGLGDSANPLLTTATVVEKIVLQQIIMIVGQAEDIAETRGVDGIYPQDILFLMRKDIHKLQRIVNYICFKDIKRVVMNSMNDGDMPGLEELSASTVDSRWESKRRITCVHFLESLGIDLERETAVDTIKQDRLLRHDLRAQAMTPKMYEDFNYSRRTTFVSARFHNNRFLDWIRQQCPDCPVNKLRSFTGEMLGYLAKETVAHVVDLALLLRQDSMVNPTDPFSRAQHTTLPFETFGSSHRQLEGPPPITPDEVREVVRRYYSTQLCPWGAFTVNLDPTVFNKILAC
ncbi:transcription initiation protein SPT3 homolog [Homalodisca vitripennis]|uniref:transcription initiation protein SPT3 homolog n=1 Tax=Homalodisca vitripennis TaxID=197043 RepID=UPI001EEBE979|nr:transcription initiation protein SPT3 homolog [Homalodisca vitripennis]XP_046667157.1 transcription initiation protein SPT3 homolog [Homalodisca vitripennis]XP_046667158.1 transcription initiation protein SPT3 homolog [Homalodisca vitripennis]